ncbi:hypothetical protein KSP40_PGU007113 [Platanthera guangdongensis]|uniref:IST1-like protein n=1 Tax=Platanthera guangdongensis TaxID=2320717 RepID=A0ABR2MQF4_9ASPA
MGLASYILLRRRFNSSKCKTEANLVSARIKLLRNKREAQVRQMRRDIAMLIQSGEEDTARIRVEHVIREQKVMSANEVINLFCELIVVRLPIIQKQRDCPADLKEAISSVIYAAPRCSDIPELSRIRDIFEKKYGKDFVSAAADLRPESGVNRLLVEKLSIRKPGGEVKLKMMKEIAKEYQIEWNSKETEDELLKPPEELIEGPTTFISASSFPIKRNLPPQNVQMKEHALSDSEESTMHFKNTALAAQAAAESAKKAASCAAQAAVFLAQQSSNESRRDSALNSANSSGKKFSSQSFNVSNHDDDTVDFYDRKSMGRSNTTGCRFHDNIKLDESESRRDSAVNSTNSSGKRFCSRSFNVWNHMNDGDGDNDDVFDLNEKKILGRSGTTGHRFHGDIKFDESDGYDSESEAEVLKESRHGRGGNLGPPMRRPPVPPTISGWEDGPTARNWSTDSVQHVHPKLPDYEELTARFQALKSQRP